MVSCLSVYCFVWLIHWLTDWLLGSLIHLFIRLLIHSLVDWSIGRFVEWLILDQVIGVWPFTSNSSATVDTHHQWIRRKVVVPRLIDGLIYVWPLIFNHCLYHGWPAITDDNQRCRSYYQQLPLLLQLLTTVAVDPTTIYVKKQTSPLIPVESITIFIVAKHYQHRRFRPIQTWHASLNKEKHLL